MNGVSIIVCCYNSADRIGYVLKHLALQKNIHFPLEIILIDNNSSDLTGDIVLSEWKALGTPFKLIVEKEPKPGLSNARNKGLAMSNYDIVIFCDDDNWLCDTYVEKAFFLMDKQLDVAIIGGCGEPYFEVSPPDEVVLHIEQYAVGPQASQSGDVTQTKGYVYGAGIVVRKKFFVELYEKGFTFTLEGRKGNVLTSGEDYELCQAMILAGHKIYYEQTLEFKHYLTKGRLNLEYLIKMNEGFGYSFAFLYPYIYLSATENYSESKSYSYILFKQVCRTIMKACVTIAGKRSFDSKLKWRVEYSILKSLLINRHTIAKLCRDLPLQTWIKK